MKKRVLLWVLGVAFCLPAATWVVLAAAPAQKKAAQAKPKAKTGLVIDHKQVGCIIAGKYPKLNACFTPTENLARARVYFRADGTPHWYFVEMKPEDPCLTGVLLKPKKSMIGKKLDLYVEALGRDLEMARTDEYTAMVVKAESECKSELPVAAWLPKASVTVGATAGAPAIPAGFGGGLSALAMGGIIGGGAGLIGGGTYVATRDGGDKNTPTPTPQRPTPEPPTPEPPTPEPPTPPPTPTPFTPRFVISPNPPQGPEPLTITFNMCDSAGIDLSYLVQFDLDRPPWKYDGGCLVTHPYYRDHSVRGTSMPVTSVAPGQYAARMTVTDNGQDPPQSESRDYVIEVTASSFGVQQATPRRMAWTSDLDVPGGSGQIVVNGRSALFARPGRLDGVVAARAGVNRIEALLVDGDGPGTWRFDFSQTPSLRPGSLRVLAGSVALTTADAIVFSLDGHSGERIVFTLETER